MQVKTYLLCQWFSKVSANVTPSAPSAPDIAFGSNETSTTVTWTNGATLGTTNELWKSTDGVNFVFFASVGGAVTQKADATGMVAGNIWYYKVRACNGTTCSAFTAVVSASFNYTSPNVAAISFPNLVRAYGFFRADPLAALISVSLPALKSVLGDLDLANNPNFTTITLTVLASVGGNLFLGSNKLTGAVSLPALVSTGGDLQVQSNTLLTSFSVAALTTIGGNFTMAGCTSCTAVSISNLSNSPSSMDFSSCTSLPTISMPNLPGVGGGLNLNACVALTTLNINSLLNLDANGQFVLTGCNALVNLSAPTLNTSGEIDFDSCTLLTTVSFPNLVIIGASNIFSINGQSSPALTTLSIPNVGFATDGLQFNVSGCHLNAASINQILARGVASGVTAYDFELAGGTNAAPSGQGVVDKAALILAGNTVNTN